MNKPWFAARGLASCFMVCHAPGMSNSRRYSVRLGLPEVLRYTFNYDPLRSYDSLTVDGEPAGSRYGSKVGYGIPAQVFRSGGERVRATQVIWAMVTGEARNHNAIPTRYGESNSQAWAARGLGYAALILPYLRSKGLPAGCLRLPTPEDVARPTNMEAIATQAARFPAWSTRRGVGPHHVDAALADLAYYAACGDDAARGALFEHLPYDAATARLDLASQYLRAVAGPRTVEPLPLL